MIGIVILNYNNWHDTEKCILSIRNNLPHRKYKIYLVDNASTINMTEGIKILLEFNDIELLTSDLNKGYAAGNNIGINKAKSEGCGMILIANNDIVFHRNAIDELVGFLDKNPSHGIVGPKLLKNNGSIQFNNMCIKTGLMEKYLVRTKLSIFNKKLKERYFGLNKDMNTTFDVYAVPGCCFLVSEKCINDIFPFDENTFLFEEELILGIKMEEKGYKTAYFPKAEVTHAHGQSTKENSGFAQVCFVESEIYYCKKYLKAPVIKIIPLYILRTLHWVYDSLLYESFRKNFANYFKRTLKALCK